MHRFLIAAVVLAVILAGCATTKTEAEKRREAFRLSHVPKEHKSSFLSANALITDGDHYFYQATGMPELKHRHSLLRKAGAKYRRAIIKLREILAKVKDPTDREYVTHVIEHTATSLEEVVMTLPISDY